MKIVKYDIIEFVPLIIAIFILIVYRASFPFCVKDKECFGNLILISSFVATVLSYSIYKWSQVAESLIAYFSKWQKRRLLMSSFLWGILFVSVLVKRCL